MDLDDQADNQMAKMRQKQPKKAVKGERRFRKQMRELVGLMPDLQAEESLLDDAGRCLFECAERTMPPGLDSELVRSCACTRFYNYHTTKTVTALAQQSRTCRKGSDLPFWLVFVFHWRSFL